MESVTRHVSNTLRTSISLLCFSLAAFSGSFAAEAAESKAPVEWLLTQKEDTNGLNTVHITHDAIKIVNLQLGTHIVARAPDWAVHCFQPKEKLEWVGKLEFFSGGAMVNPYTTPKGPVALSAPPVAAGKLLSLNYRRYNLGRNVFFATDDISIAPKAAEFFARFYGTPYLRAVPIYSCTFLGAGEQPSSAKAKDTWVDLNETDDLRSGTRVNLTTVSCKKIPYQSSDFELPVNYKRSSDLITVTLSAEKKHQFDEMLDNVGFTSPLGRKAQTEPSKVHR